MRDTEVFTFDKYNKQNNPVLCVPVGAANNYNRDLWTYLDIVEGETIIGEVGEDLNMIFKTNDTDDNSVSIGFGDKRVPTLIGNTDVTRLSLPDNIKDHQVTEIAPYAFQGYSKLKEVVIPASISAIGNYAFADCIGLRSVTTLIDLPFKLDQSVFQYSNTSYDKNTIYYAATLYVPLGRKNFYERIDYWNLFLNIEEKDVSRIESHATPTSSKEKIRFSIDGYRISPPCTGLNIIRYADGTTRKVFVK